MLAYIATAAAALSVGFYFRLSSLNKVMSINSTLPIHLTSSAVKPTEDGFYPYEQVSFLFAHEPLRREINRGKAAIDTMDVKAHPWKAQYLRVWLEEFLLPVIHDHHDSEENIFDPSYEKLGVTIPEKFKIDHAALIKALDQISAIVHQLATPGGEESKIAELRSQYNSMYELMAEHLADEEKFWPAVILEKGEPIYREIHDAMHKDAKNQKSGKNFLMSVLDSMGYEFDAECSTHVAGDTRWCGDRLLQDTIINKIPYFVRAWIFAPYNRKYMYYKKLILETANGTENTMPLTYDESSCTVC